MTTKQEIYDLCLKDVRVQAGWFLADLAELAVETTTEQIIAKAEDHYQVFAHAEGGQALVELRKALACLVIARGYCLGLDKDRMMDTLSHCWGSHVVTAFIRAEDEVHYIGEGSAAHVNESLEGLTAYHLNVSNNKSAHRISKVIRTMFFRYCTLSFIHGIRLSQLLSDEESKEVKVEEPIKIQSLDFVLQLADLRSSILGSLEDCGGISGFVETVQPITNPTEYVTEHLTITLSLAINAIEHNKDRDRVKQRDAAGLVFTSLSILGYLYSLEQEDQTTQETSSSLKSLTTLYFPARIPEATRDDALELLKASKSQISADCGRVCLIGPIQKAFVWTFHAYLLLKAQTV